MTDTDTSAMTTTRLENWLGDRSEVTALAKERDALRAQLDVVTDERDRWCFRADGEKARTALIPAIIAEAVARERETWMTVLLNMYGEKHAADALEIVEGATKARGNGDDRD